jgi:hypothetical protein
MLAKLATGVVCFNCCCLGQTYTTLIKAVDGVFIMLLEADACKIIVYIRMINFKLFISYFAQFNAVDLIMKHS